MLGHLSLNLSFFIYCIQYLPQIIHNQKNQDLNGLSIHMHAILYLAYFLDLLYGMLLQLPWQYRIVSTLGWIYLTLQHIQFIKHYQRKRRYRTASLCYGLLIGSLFLLPYAGHILTNHTPIINCLGFVAQIGFCGALIPQFIKSRQLESAEAISPFYIALNCFLSCLDIISAWQLHWGWPNKLGSILQLFITLLLFIQNRRYTVTRR